MLQAIAAGWHNQTKESLKELGDKVGRERILVLHGVDDKMIDVVLGKRLIEWLEPGRAEVVEGVGHVFMMERGEWHDELIEERFEMGERMSGRL